MTVEIKRTRLGDAFAAMPRVVRPGYVSLDDVKALRRYHGKTKTLLEIVERCNRYCDVANQSKFKLMSRRIAAELRKQHGGMEGDRVITYARAYRKIIPPQYWATGWHGAKEPPVGELPGIQANGNRPVTHLPRVVPAGQDLSNIVAWAAYGTARRVPRQLHEHGIYAEALKAQIERRLTESQAKELHRRWTKDIVVNLQSLRGHILTDAWKATIGQLREDVNICLTHGAMIDNLLGDSLESKIAFDVLTERASTLEMEVFSLRHPSRRHLPNPIRPLIVVIRRMRLALGVLVRGR